MGLLGDPKKISAGDIKTFVGTLTALSGPERTQLVDELANNEVMTHLDQALADEHPLSNWDKVFGGGDAPLDRKDLVQLYSLLLSSASAGVVSSLVANVPGIDPSMSGVSGWTENNGQEIYIPVPAPRPQDAVPHDAEQGQVGDCYFISSLIAVAGADPSFVSSHMHPNGNGTTTVTLYQGGKPVETTVTDTVPVSPQGDGGGASGIGSGVTTIDGPSWPALYEKAYAQLQGGYGNIDQGGTGSQGLSPITGTPTTTASAPGIPSSVPLIGGDNVLPPNVSINTINTLLQQNHAVIVGTNTRSGNTNDVVNSDLNGKLIENHEYVVTGASNGMVTLRNPWDPSDTPKIPWSEFEKQCSDVTWTTTAP